VLDATKNAFSHCLPSRREARAVLFTETQQMEYRFSKQHELGPICSYREPSLRPCDGFSVPTITRQCRQPAVSRLVTFNHGSRRARLLVVRLSIHRQGVVAGNVYSENTGLRPERATVVYNHSIYWS